MNTQHPQIQKFLKKWNGKLYYHNFSQGKKDGSYLLGKHLETRSKAREDNLQESMLVDVDNHPDTYRPKYIIETPEDIEDEWTK